MAESTRTAFLLLVGALVSKMDRKNLVFDEEMQALLAEAIRKQLLPNDHIDGLLTMTIRKNLSVPGRGRAGDRDRHPGASGTPAGLSGGGSPQSPAASHAIPKIDRSKIVMGRRYYLIVGYLLLALMLALVMLARFPVISLLGN